MDSYVINLDSRPDKWKKVQRSLARVGLDATRVAAFDAAAGRQRLPSAEVDGGDLGLVASFVGLVEQLSSSSAEWVLVFEDDARFTRAFTVPLLEGILQQAPDGVALVQFGFLTGSEWRRENGLVKSLHRFIRPRARLVALRNYHRGVSLQSPRSFRVGTHAIAVRPSGARKIVEAMQPYDGPLDHLVHRAMRQQPEAFVQTSKRLVSQRAHRSDISPTRRVVDN